ncbi:hypothetical protein KDA14_05990, partial [Candidatus Saccharibacteria bacterium]|nr:hypothetical protein [Candidatus Saccharibacteria bacterium]
LICERLLVCDSPMFVYKCVMSTTTQSLWSALDVAVANINYQILHSGDRLRLLFQLHANTVEDKWRKELGNAAFRCCPGQMERLIAFRLGDWCLDHKLCPRNYLQNCVVYPILFALHAHSNSSLRVQIEWTWFGDSAQFGAVPTYPPFNATRTQIRHTLSPLRMDLRALLDMKGHTNG